MHAPLPSQTQNDGYRRADRQRQQKVIEAPAHQEDERLDEADDGEILQPFIVLDFIDVLQGMIGLIEGQLVIDEVPRYRIHF